ncbi:MAG: ATP-binding cassette domain-containing protein [Candidatus Gastranaerophilales bacterium]|nr:ATP-binding cassette domain-containing protein [Candidatus Gastranaerophilales bacterium]
MEHTVQITDLTKIFTGSAAAAIDNLSLNIEKGKITGLMGADGAGKTTLIRLVTGLLRPTSGNITTLGLNPYKQKSALNPKIGYMPQKFGLYEDLTVIENLNLYADLKNVRRDFKRLLEFTDLTNFQDRLAGKLSGGMKQKLGLACSLLGNPEFLVLDEPSVGVDPISRRELMKMVQESMNENMTVLWSTAYLDEAHSFDTAIVLDNGRVIFNDKPNKLSETTQGFENKIIEIMGGYSEGDSLIAKSFVLEPYELEYPVEALNLVKKYGDFYAVEENTFHIKKGEIFGLLGPNGAGKSTSFKMMCGLAKPTSGTAKIMGVDILEKPSLARSYLGYMAQKFSLYSQLSVRQNLKFFSGVYGLYGKEQARRIDEAIDVFGLKEYEFRNSEELPLGFKQRLSLACALIHNPPILFLDEPTSGVDVVTRRDFWNHIKALAKKGVTILVTTHFMDEAEYCDRISLFYKGRAISVGTPEELKNQAQSNTMEEAFITLIQESEKQE